MNLTPEQMAKGLKFAHEWDNIPPKEGGLGLSEMAHGLISLHGLVRELVGALDQYVTLREEKTTMKYADESTPESERIEIRKRVADNIIKLLHVDDKANAALQQAKQIMGESGDE